MDDKVKFEDSVEFGKKGEAIVYSYLKQELHNAYKNKEFNLVDVTQNCICQFAGLDFAFQKKNINSLEDLSNTILDAIEVKSHLWVNFDNHIADLAFEVYSDYDQRTVGWTTKTVGMIDKGILPFVRIFWINKDQDNHWVASIQLNKKFSQFWKTNPWHLDHRINKPSYDGNRQWRSSWSPIKVLTLQREGIPYTYFSLKNYKFNNDE